MKNSNIFYCLFILVIIFQSCKFEIKEFTKPFDSEELEKMTQEDKQWLLYKSIDLLDYENVEVLLENGADPNFCEGRLGWFDSNPLMVVADSWYDSFTRLHLEDTVPIPPPDLRTFELLIKWGAYINKYPYVWYRINRTTNDDIEKLWEMHLESAVNGQPIFEKSEKEDFTEYLIEDEKRLIEAFLKAGANPDMLGHPYPFSYEAMEAGITDEQAKKYFEKGTRAINEAIQKGMVWESQVDLLLQYTNLDEESLRAAERSGDPEMVKKIQKLWKKQCKSGKQQ